ncbi:MAG: hypothetical protein Q9164_006878, partial [Protoblastenia rupestris]
MMRRSGDFNTRILGENPSYSVILNQGSASTELDGSRRKSLFNPSKFHIQRVQAYKGASDDDDGGAGSFDNDVSTHIINVSLGEPGKDESLGSDDSGEGPPYESSSQQSTEALDNEAATLSFGALVNAQKSLGKRKRPDIEPYNEDVGHSKRYPGDSEATERMVGKKDVRDFTRTSKHAPTELSSKKAVSRKRAVVGIHKHEARDPRFESVTGSLDEEKMKKNYAFLDAYRNLEIAELNAGLRKIIDPTVKETLKHALIRMESKKKTQQLKKQRQEVLRQHRKDESEKVEKGKNPFYLKR